MGPLSDIRVVEFAAIGPVPFAGMLLADMGADMVRIDRVGGDPDPLRNLMARGRRSVGLDLKHADGAALALELIGSADVVIEGMRPGVLERLGLGPNELLERNPRLIVGRMTGWGQRGPYADQAGHDINYLGVTGGLHAIGAAALPPPPPLNLIADFGGGAMYLLTGILAALHERDSSGLGQIVDVAMVDGVSSLLTMFHQMLQRQSWTTTRESNLLDGGAPFYRTYACADGELVSVGALEPQFYAELVSGLGFDSEDLPPQTDVDAWSSMRERFAARFAERPRHEWLEAFSGSDACVFPVHDLASAGRDPHLEDRGTLVAATDGFEPTAAPQMSRTNPSRARESGAPGTETDEILAELGYTAAQIDPWRLSGIVG